MRKIAQVFCWLVVSVILTFRGTAGLPLPSLTFYGMFLDEFGWPYSTDDYVEVYANGVRIFSHNLTSSVGKDYNFLARVPYDSGGRFEDYSPDVISPGDSVTVDLVDNGTGSTVISTNFICNLPPGTVVNINAMSGVDSLGDGLPDDLRRWIWAVLGGGGPFDASQIRATDDSDGDGVSNLNEFLAGTDPANAEDVLKVVIDKAPGSPLAQLSFFSVPGKPYKVERGQFTSSGVVWSTATFSSNPASNETLQEAVGTGHSLSLFVPASDDTSFFRVVVNARKRGATILP
ncbi:MAG TPA: hypothetical protein VMF06_04370 [Candidatus Limnocylindria bacterium]|jgi:hypothetical protein|nr:hypothetical protein [Candidatus Limnocylindria bacterium]